MASVSDSVDVPLTPDEAWRSVSDLSRYDQWLTIHDGWRSPVPAPDDLARGLTISSVVAVKGTRVRFEWTVDTFDPPKLVSLKGKGKGGVKVTLKLTVTPNADGSTVTFDLDLGGLPMIGPAGKAGAKLVHSDLHSSLEKFRRVFAM